MRLPKKVAVTTADSQSKRDQFLSQCANNDDVSVMSQLKQLLKTRITNGSDVQEVVEMTTERAVQQALVQAAVKEPLKRKNPHLQGDDASMLAWLSACIFRQ